MNGEEVISLYNNLEREKQDAASWASELKKFVYPFSPTGLPSSFSFLGVGLKTCMIPRLYGPINGLRRRIRVF